MGYARAGVRSEHRVLTTLDADLTRIDYSDILGYDFVAGNTDSPHQLDTAGSCRRRHDGFLCRRFRQKNIGFLFTKVGGGNPFAKDACENKSSTPFAWMT